MAGKKQGKSSKKDRQHVKHTGKYGKQYYKTYKNKTKAWKKHLATHPNDVQNNKDIPKAIENAKTI